MNREDLIIVTPVYNFDLYHKTIVTFPSEISKIVVDGRSGLYGLEYIFFICQYFMDSDVKWMILVDEDVIYLHHESIFNLINFMEKNKFHVSGMRDGGQLPGRLHNPYVINPYFVILDFEFCRSIFNQNEILSNNFTKQNEFSDDLSLLAYDFDTLSLFEPYYSFFLWLKRKSANFLYLNARLNSIDDGYANNLYDNNGNIMLIHTWYARKYSYDRFHRKRINKYIGKYVGKSVKKVKYILISNNKYSFKYLFKIIYLKIRQLANLLFDKIHN